MNTQHNPMNNIEISILLKSLSRKALYLAEKMENDGIFKSSLHHALNEMKLSITKMESEL